MDCQIRPRMYYITIRSQASRINFTLWARTFRTSSALATKFRAIWGAFLTNLTIRSEAVHDFEDVVHRPVPLVPGLWVAALVISLFLLLPLQAIALPGEEGTRPQKIHELSLEDILRIGMEVSPKLWEQRSVIDEAEAQLGEAKAGRLPRVNYLQIAGLIPEAKGNATYFAQQSLGSAHRSGSVHPTGDQDQPAPVHLRQAQSPHRGG